MKKTFKIQPAGRHINSIGSDLIKDQYAALVELVKNSYDADATEVNIVFASTYDNESKEPNGISIEVIDNGHGMDYSTVTGIWMTPSTSDKLERKFSPKERPLQGRKGLGRYAVSMLGNEIILDTVKDKLKTVTYINWDDFERAEFLSDIEIEISNSKTDKADGTSVLIQGGKNYLEAWTEKEIKNLIFELKKLKSPDLEEEGITENLPFNIKLKFDESWYDDKYAGREEDIYQFPLFKNYHYRIWGCISKSGAATLKYHNSRINNSAEIIQKSIPIEDSDEYPGSINVDFRVFDRDSKSIQHLIDQGLKVSLSGEAIGKRQARQLLSVYNGIGVYRNKFRIRPLGDPGFDWLELDKDRVQNPSRRIGSDQVIGYVHVESEEKSGLEEKSARDGLRENRFYFGLKSVCAGVLQMLEERRYIYRTAVGLSRSKSGLQDKVDNLFKFESLKTDIVKILDELEINDDAKQEVVQLIELETRAKNELANDIQRIIAIYQGQATVGKIVDILLHEGRRSLNFFKSEAPRLRKKVEKIVEECPNLEAQKEVDYVKETSLIIEEETSNLSNLFARIDPLASRRAKRKDFNLKDCFSQAVAIFNTELKNSNILVINNISSDIKIHGWKADFSAAFVNLIDNSIYWMKKVNAERKIEIHSKEVSDELRLTYSDTGPGIPEELIESQVIFEPDFSTKIEGGMGLGLAIAGEAIQRNKGKLTVEIPEHDGAYFVITLNTGSNE